jgi:heat shock protein HslJ
MNRYKLTLTLTLAAGLILAACQPVSVTISGENQLAGTQWVLTELRGQPVIPGPEVTADFTNTEILGQASCNSYSAPYSSSGSSLNVEQAVATRMACMEPAGLMDQEQQYLQTLTEVSAYQLDGDVLRMQDASGAAVLVFQRQP